MKGPFSPEQITENKKEKTARAHAEATPQRPANKNKPSCTRGKTRPQDSANAAALPRIHHALIVFQKYRIICNYSNHLQLFSFFSMTSLSSGQQRTVLF